MKEERIKALQECILECKKFLEERDELFNRGVSLSRKCARIIDDSSLMTMNDSIDQMIIRKMRMKILELEGY